MNIRTNVFLLMALLWSTVPAAAGPLKLDVKTVLAIPGLTPVTIDVIELHETTAHTAVRAQYRGVALRDLLARLFPDAWAGHEGDVYLYARDGYLSIVPADKVRRFDACLVYTRVDGAPFVIDNIHQNERNIPLGPFYLVWDNVRHAELADESSYDWPYQIDRLELVSREVLEQQLPADATPAEQQGFIAYTGNCISCHSINGFGGKKVPRDMKQLVAGRTRAELAAIIDNPRAVNPASTMPPLHSRYANERPVVINQIIDYLESL